MNQQIIKKMLLVMVSLLMVFLASCGGIPGFKVAPNPDILETELNTATVEIRNCAEFENEKRIALIEKLPIVVRVTLTDKAFSEETGEAIEIPKALKRKLEAAIEKEYITHLEEKQNKIADVDLVVPAFSIRVYDVLWSQECICSVVVFGMENQIYTANFSYRLEYPTLVRTFQMGCTA